MTGEKIALLSPETGGAGRFALDVLWSRLVDGEWSARQATLLTFAAAEFEEIEA